MNNSNIY